jgi:two-component system, sensor histidine kinase and response regulator
MVTPNKVSTQCEECGKKYKINLSGVEAQYVKFTCKNCNAANVVENPVQNLSNFSMEPQSGGDGAMPVRNPIQFKGLSIRSRITLVFVLLVLISLSVVGLVASQRSRTALSTQAEAFLLLSAKQKAGEYALSFERIQQEAEGIAALAKEYYERKSQTSNLGMEAHLLMPWTGSGYGSPEVNRPLLSESLTLQQLVQVMKHMVAKNPTALAGYMGTATRIIAMNSADDVASIGQLVGFENTKRPWYIKAQEQNKTVWTDPYIDATTQDLIITCASPVVLSNNTLAGVIGYDVLLSTIQKDVLTLDIGYNSYALLVDNKGKALVRPGMTKGDGRWDRTYDTTDLLRTDNAEYNAIVGRMVTGRSGVESYTTEEGVKYIAYAPLPKIGASVAIVASKDEVVRPAVAIQNFIIIVWAVVLVVAVIAGFVVGNGITKPINELTKAADLISQGKMDLDALPPTKRKDEIGLLTQAFNRLVTSLRIAMSR